MFGKPVKSMAPGFNERRIIELFRYNDVQET
jgi:hypothetical protein